MIYRLASAEFVHAPGLIAWAQNGARFENDREKLITVVEKTWNIPRAAAEALVMNKVPFKIENETVIFGDPS